MSSQEIGKENERKVAEDYRKKGYQVLNVNEEGFPDLIILKNGKIEFLIEVKTPKHPVHKPQREYHKQLEAIGLPVKIEIVEA